MCSFLFFGRGLDSSGICSFIISLWLLIFACLVLAKLQQQMPSPFMARVESASAESVKQSGSKKYIYIFFLTLCFCSKFLFPLPLLHLHQSLHGPSTRAGFGAQRRRKNQSKRTLILIILNWSRRLLRHLLFQRFQRQQMTFCKKRK